MKRRRSFRIFFQDIIAHCPWQKFRSFLSFMAINSLFTTVYRTSGVYLSTRFILSNLDEWQIWANLFVTTGGCWSNKQNLTRTGPTLSNLAVKANFLLLKSASLVLSTCFPPPVSSFTVINPYPTSYFKLGTSVYKFSKMFTICFMSGFDETIFFLN